MLCKSWRNRFRTASLTANGVWLELSGCLRWLYLNIVMVCKSGNRHVESRQHLHPNGGAARFAPITFIPKMGAARFAPLPTQDCAYSKTQPQNRSLPNPYSNLTPTIFIPYSNLTQTLPTQNCAYSKIQPQIKTLPRPYSDPTPTRFRPYPNLTHAKLCLLKDAITK